MPVDASITDFAQQKHGQLKEAQSKAQELLASLEQSRKQKLANEKLKNLCLDNEELMQKTNRHAYAARQRQDVTRLYQKAGQLMQDLTEGLSYTQLTKFNVDRFMKMCSQEMAVQELVQPGSQPNSTDCAQVRDTLQNMRGLGDSAAPYTPTIDLGLQLMQRSLELFAQSKLHSRQWAQVMGPLLVLLKDVMHAPALDQCLIVPEEEVRRMKFAIEECSQQQMEAISDGEMKEAEAIYYRKIQMQEDLSHLVKQKVTVLDNEGVQAFEIPMKRVHECHNKANLDISNILKENEMLRKRAEQDLQNLQTQMEKVAVDDYNLSKQYTEEQEISDAFLKEVFQKQEACWSQMEALERQLVALGDERHKEVARRIQALEHEERRKVDHQQFMEFAERQRNLLQLTIRNCEIAEEITDTVDEFISSSCNAIERRMREVEKEIEQMKVVIHEEYLACFRNMYLTIGDLQYKKERNMEELDKKIQTAHIQQEFAMETFNPKAKEFSQQKKALQSEKKQMEEQVDSLRNRAVAYIEWFHPTEQALIEAGRDFKHPVEELAELNASRANKLIEYHALMTQQEDDDDEYAAEIAEIERLRALTAGKSPARLTAPPTLNGATPSGPATNTSRTFGPSSINLGSTSGVSGRYR